MEGVSNLLAARLSLIITGRTRQADEQAQVELSTGTGRSKALFATGSRRRTDRIDLTTFRFALAFALSACRLAIAASRASEGERGADAGAEEGRRSARAGV